MQTIIPPDIEKFILENIDTIAQLEALLLFHADPTMEASAEDVAKRLYISEREAETLLEHLALRGFLKTRFENNKTLYRLLADDPENAARIASLAAVYKQYLVPVTYLVHSKHKSKIQKFADAFWIRKE